MSAPEPVLVPRDRDDGLWHITTAHNPDLGLCGKDLSARAPSSRVWVSDGIERDDCVVCSVLALGGRREQ